MPSSSTEKQALIAALEDYSLEEACRTVDPWALHTQGDPWLGEAVIEYLRLGETIKEALSAHNS